MTRHDGASRSERTDTVPERPNAIAAEPMRLPPVEAFHRIVAEAIDAVAHPTEARAILAEALMNAGLPALPSRADLLAVFTSFHLRHALERRVGDLAANSVEAEIVLMLERAATWGVELAPQDTGVRPRRRSHRVRDVPPPAEVASREPCDSPTTPRVENESLRLLVVATSDRRAAAEFLWFDDERTNVVVVSDRYAFLAAVASRGAREPVVIVDGAAPTLDPSMLSTLERAPGDPLRVVLWRYAPEVASSLRTLSHYATRWSAIRRGARARDVIAFVTHTSS